MRPMIKEPSKVLLKAFPKQEGQAFLCYFPHLLPGDNSNGDGVYDCTTIQAALVAFSFQILCINNITVYRCHLVNIKF